MLFVRHDLFRISTSLAVIPEVRGVSFLTWPAYYDENVQPVILSSNYLEFVIRRVPYFHIRTSGIETIDAHGQRSTTTRDTCVMTDWIRPAW